jgi:endonuclease-3
VARKTANVVLAHAFDIHEGVTVDTHVKRISNLLGLTQHSDPVRIEQDLMKLLPQPDWENWSIRLVYHGRAVCTARSPQCSQCDLLDICPGAIKLRKEAAKAAKLKEAAKAAKLKADQAVKAKMAKALTAKTAKVAKTKALKKPAQ